jgi:hypothetical protein
VGQRREGPAAGAEAAEGVPAGAPRSREPRGGRAAAREGIRFRPQGGRPVSGAVPGALGRGRGRRRGDLPQRGRDRGDGRADGAQRA